MNVSIKRGATHVEVTVSGIPSKGSAGASWILFGGHRVPAEPHELANGEHRIDLIWACSELLERSLLINVRTPDEPAEPPAVAIGSGSPMPLFARLDRTYEMRIELEVGGS